MNGWLRKASLDPVGSKVIAGIILAALGGIYIRASRRPSAAIPIAVRRTSPVLACEPFVALRTQLRLTLSVPLRWTVCGSEAASVAT